MSAFSVWIFFFEMIVGGIAYCSHLHALTNDASDDDDDDDDDD